jgi:hypothetical protein
MEISSQEFTWKSCVEDNIDKLINCVEDNISYLLLHKIIP